MMVEFHPCEDKQIVKISLVKTPQKLLRYWRTLRAIDELGFKLWKVWNNYSCRFKPEQFKDVQYYGCFNACYLNIKYLV